MHLHAALLLALTTQAFAVSEPLITAAAQLFPRQNIDPALVGYISASGGYSEVRSCDYPQTLSTQNNYVQCCPTSGACPFYTSCSSNTLLGASVDAVPCDNDPTLTCNTAIVVETAGANGGGSYLACWQRTLGSSPFTFVRDIGTASVAAPSTTATITGANTNSDGSSSESVTTMTGSTEGTTSTATNLPSSSEDTGAAATSINAAGPVEAGLGSGGVVGVVVMVVQAFL